MPSSVQPARNKSSTATARADHGPQREHAVVLGAGVAGLCAARVLADHFQHVTVIERDPPAAGDHTRKGVPQGTHLHGLALRGAEVFEELFPGLLTELTDAGATPAQALTQMRVIFFGHLLRQVPTGSHFVMASRPFLENRLHARVSALPHVTLLDRHEATRLLSHGGTVNGVQVVSTAPDATARSIEADLVVDALGRSGRGAAWLMALGYTRPTEDRVRVDVRYASCRYRLPPDCLGTDRGVAVGATIARPRGLAFFAQENGIWALSLFGYGTAHHPPTSPEEFLARTQELAPGDVWEALRNAQPVGPITTFGYPAVIRRRYHQLRRLPDGLLSIGDAVCSLNPIYGTGMTVAAMEALALRDCLRYGTGDLPRRYYRATGKAIRIPWAITMLADSTLPQVPTGHRLTKRAIATCLEAVLKAAAADPRVAATLWGIISLTTSPTKLLRRHVFRSIYRNRWQSPETRQASAEDPFPSRGRS
ncbi:FAD-dependent oxidoreductase [Streptomyces sp. NBC_01304]|uniref:FAD-dependent oxidoreductase n=1 Tax=Streptomyces sp. NBC_01304 TaxID=2903818 RepID=UPI002E13DF01|nr:FAD-dependent oxidoreductase [Streptomyces sp. NBC_01304]